MSIKGMVVVMTFSVMAWKSLGLKWTTEALHTNCCEGQDTILMWNYSLEQNETVQGIDWFFNHLTHIAFVSSSGKFVVNDLYKCRVEQIGKMGICLKNVSSVDAGNYTFYLNLGPEPPENMQTIFLTVFEAPRYQCKPSITNYSKNVVYCLTNCQLSTEWRRSEKYDFVSNESYLKINSSWNYELVSWCCLKIQNMQCWNGNLLDFCASTLIFFAEDKHDYKSMYTEYSTILTGAVIVLAPTCFICFVVICFSYRKKIRKLCARRDKEQEPNIKHEARPMMEGARRDKEQDPNIEHEARPKMEDRISETSRTIHLHEIGFRPCPDRISETSRTIHLHEIGFRPCPEASHQPLPSPALSVYSKPNVPAAAAATAGSGGSSNSSKSSTPTTSTGGRVHSIASLTPCQNRQVN